jgi:hypothetical protein
LTPRRPSLRFRLATRRLFSNPFVGVPGLHVLAEGVLERAVKDDAKVLLGGQGRSKPIEVVQPKG